jgi:hypothetical protein
VATAVISVNGGGGAYVGIGLDGALGDISNSKQQASMMPSTIQVSYQTSAKYSGYVGQGHHTMPWLERLYVPGPYVWLGYIPPSQVSGISGKVFN